MGTAKIVLTVDGSTVVRAIVRRHLGRHGCSVLEAADSATARDLARDHQPAVIVADRGELVALAADERCAAIPTIALVTDANAPAPCAAACLVRPFQAQTFDRAFARALAATGSARP